MPEPTPHELRRTAIAMLEEEFMVWRDTGDVDIPTDLKLGNLAEQAVDFILRNADLLGDDFMEAGAGALAKFVDGHETIMRIGPTLDCDPTLFQFLGLYAEKAGQKLEPEKPAQDAEEEGGDMVASLAAHLLSLVNDGTLELANNITGHDTETGQQELTRELASRFLGTIRKQMSRERFEEMLMDWLCEQPEIAEVY